MKKQNKSDKPEKAKNKENEDYLDSLKRLKAEFENYQKRVEKESTENSKFKSEDLILKLLNLKDNFERSLEHGKDDEFGKGIKMILEQFEGILKDENVKVVDVEGKEFDASRHEAVGFVKGKKNLVLEEVEKGYELFEKVIRPSKVKIGQGE
ncbi:MAG: nucleotide exchange factor GrpE [Nanoarchaeota archaeon]|nr:nucleotide exchange factor GrpE [Nanoarchaeota archaeon]|tara:strand:- start:128 stop:583 length:456 start_codon:yes stop_codon:yes gene_type:complete